jgi:hypothetical protein
MVADQSGNGRHGTLQGGATFVAGMFGNAVSLDGTDDHVDLPDGLLSAVRDVTVAVWIRVQTARDWQRAFDVGSNSNVYMMLTPRAGGGANVMRFFITTNGTSGTQQLNAPVPATGSWTHVAVVLGPQGGVLYVSGARAAMNTAIALRPADLGATANNWLGRSQLTQTPYFAGQLDELRIYDRALGDAEIAALVTNP